MLHIVITIDSRVCNNGFSESGKFTAKAITAIRAEHGYFYFTTENWIAFLNTF